MEDLLYFYDKTNFVKTELGEIQTRFNMGLTIDGTKDSLKVTVFSYIEKVIESFTIVKHKNTNTWWIVSNDQVERFRDRSGTFIYRHTLQLEGAIELLNARDSTDRGFYQNRYTIRNLVNELLKTSSFEFKDNYTIVSPQLDLDMTIDSIKSFENYSLSTALNEIADGYNMSIKLSFEETTVGNTTTLTSAILTFVSKTGDNTLPVVSEGTFNQVEETKNMNKNSFGSTVVSNAENVVSTSTKTYPSTGLAKLSANDYNITNGNAILRLPSNIFNVNWLRMYKNTRIVFRYLYSQAGSTDYIDATYTIRAGMTARQIEEELRTWLPNAGLVISGSGVAGYQLFLNNVVQIANSLEMTSHTTFYNVENYNAIDDNFIAPKNIDDFYFAGIKNCKTDGSSTQLQARIVLGPKDLGDNIKRKIQMITWERGKDYIDNFDFLTDNSQTTYYTYLNNGDSTDFNGKQPRTDKNEIYYHSYEESGNTWSWSIRFEAIAGAGTMPITGELKTDNVFFKVNYVPMNDLKIKVDNSANANDMSLYNQNGKLTDSMALSKLMLSYSKEIESDNLVKNGVFYDFDAIPKVGQLANIDNSFYVINNISYDFYPNENGEYEISCQFNLTKNTSVKSLLTNPNTNVRDYGIPQNYNVKRKQLYRDFYELGHSVETSADNVYYVPLNEIMSLSEQYQKTNNEHTAIIKVVYKEQIGGDSDNNVDPSNTWYYQLDTTTYFMKKSFYEIIDFKDNNIIGYDSQNVWSGFDFNILNSSMYDNVNTPVSYVDEEGELRDIELAMVNTNQLLEIWDNYANDKTISKDRLPYFITRPFIPSEIFEGDSGATTPYLGAKDNCDFMITEEDYNKDAIEVPFFEYCCQIDNSDDVEIGDNILEPYNSIGELIYYESENNFIPTFVNYTLVPKGTITNNNFKIADIPQMTWQLIGGYNLNQVCKCEYNGNSEINISFYNNVNYVALINRFTYGTTQDLSSVDWTKYDLLITRKSFNNNARTNISTNQSDSLIFVVKNMENATFDENGKLVLKINHYKLN